jgi:enoyl-CoA hydratase/carnithine racemase
MPDIHPNLLTAERRDAHLWLTLNRADKANALTVSMMEGLTDAIRRAADDAEVGAILVTGAGERAFCAGADVREQPADGDMARHRERRSHALAALQDALLDTPKPVIVVLNGIASGGGAMLALLADECIGADTAALAMPEIDLGIATFSGANILEAIGGRALARSLVQTGRRMPMAEALTRGVVSRVVARSELADSATAAATVLASKKQDAFAKNKRWLNRAINAALAEARAEHARERAAHGSDTRN